MNPDSEYWYFLWVGIADVVLAVWCWTVWRDAKARWQFSIVDFWVVMVALAPAMWVGSHLNGSAFVCFIALLIPHQIGGAYLFGDHVRRSEEPPHGYGWWSAGTTFTAAMLGWVLPFVTLSVGFILFFVVAMIGVTWPVSVPALGILFLLYRRKKKADAMREQS